MTYAEVQYALSEVVPAIPFGVFLGILIVAARVTWRRFL